MDSTLRSLSRLLVIGLAVLPLRAQLSAVPGDRVPGESTVPLASPSARLPSEMAPNPPRVTCKGNQLTITADNSTMGSVFAAVHACIGVEIALPDGSADERTYFHLGPGPTREVLDAMLGSSGFDYVIESSNVAPERIMAIVVMARIKDGTVPRNDRGEIPDGNLPLTPARRAWLAGRAQARPAAPPADETPVLPDEAAPVPPVLPDIAATTPANALDPAAGGSPGDAPETNKEGQDASRTSDAATPAAVVGTEAAPAPVSADSGETTPAKELQNKIGEMKQLFEQRRKMNTNPAAPPVPN